MKTTPKVYCELEKVLWHFLLTIFFSSLDFFHTQFGPKSKWPTTSWSICRVLAHSWYWYESESLHWDPCYCTVTRNGRIYHCTQLGRFLIRDSKICHEFRKFRLGLRWLLQHLCYWDQYQILRKVSINLIHVLDFHYFDYTSKMAPRRYFLPVETGYPRLSPPPFLRYSSQTFSSLT